jgi:hypothetical protein
MFFQPARIPNAVDLPDRAPGYRPGEISRCPCYAGAFDLEKEFGVSADRMAALDRRTCLAIGAGMDAFARRRNPAGDALQDHQHRHAVAGPAHPEVREAMEKQPYTPALPACRRYVLV